MPRVGPFPQINRREAIGGIAGTAMTLGRIADDANASSAFASKSEWPEFRRWYKLTMEEQRIYNEEDDKDHERLLDAVDAERNPLEEAMLARIPNTLTEFAMLGVIELRYAERDRNPEHEECRMLELGMMSKGKTQGRSLIEGAIKNAISKNLLPGIKIYGDGGNV